MFNRKSKPPKNKAEPPAKKVTAKMTRAEKKQAKKENVVANPDIVNIKYKRPSDEIWYKSMPAMALIGCILFIVAIIWTHFTGQAYDAKQAQVAMPANTTMRTLGTTGGAVLSLGNTTISKDGKTVALEITYDDTAKRLLSAFGNRYHLAIVTSKGYNLSQAKMTYGRFDTDKSGVMTIHSDKGFKNESFAVMIIDTTGLAGRLSDTTTTGTDTTTNDTTVSSSSSAIDNDTGSSSSSSAIESDTDISSSSDGAGGSTTDKTLQDQLADGLNLSSSSSSSTDDTGSSSSSETKKIDPAIFYAIINPAQLKRSTDNFTANSPTMLKDLLVKSRATQLEKDLKDLKSKRETEQKIVTLFEQRVSANASDTTAQTTLVNEKNKLTALDQSITNKKAEIAQFKAVTFDPNKLNPMQTKFTYQQKGLTSLQAQSAQQSSANNQ